HQYRGRHSLHLHGPAYSGRRRFQMSAITQTAGMPIKRRLLWRTSLVGRIAGRTSGAVGLTLLILVAMLALLAPWLAPHDPNAQNLLARLKPPVFDGGTWAHMLGTDHLGRDILSRVMYGARISLFIGFVTALVAGVIGTTVGLLAGYYSGHVRTTLVRFVHLYLDR